MDTIKELLVYIVVRKKYVLFPLIFGLEAVPLGPSHDSMQNGGLIASRGGIWLPLCNKNDTLTAKGP